MLSRHQDAFNPVSYSKSCGGGGRSGGRHTVTEGGCPCPLPQVGTAAEHTIAIAVTLAAALVAMHAMGEIDADDRAGHPARTRDLPCGVPHQLA